MKREIWVPAVTWPAMILPAMLVLFVVIAWGLEFLHDYALWIGMVLFLAFSGGAYYFAQKAEAEFRAKQSQRRDT
jgi:hypothetical protein